MTQKENQTSVLDSNSVGIEKRAKRGRPRGNGTKTVYDALRREILTLIAKPGDHLDEAQLEKRFGVSRTPIREALIRLQADRLVRFAANRGHFVEVINLNEVPRIFEALDLYQAAVLRLAASRRTTEQLGSLRKINNAYKAAAHAGDFQAMTENNHKFHKQIGEAAGNDFIREGYETVLNFSLRLTYLMFENADRMSREPDSYYRQIHNEHDEMIDLIERGEVEELDKVSRAHTRLFCSRVSAFMEHRIALRTDLQFFEQ
uniref:GntR family transcriptional regulator n=1 Tax=Roseovarius sp. BRH_c41 TaxID=1629709 RepID=UPI000A941E1E|nr:GntR family transcriptional regulator [Roseovarius sp. BRH_c41]